jgi:hypothetical protein
MHRIGRGQYLPASATRRARPRRWPETRPDDEGHQRLRASPARLHRDLVRHPAVGYVIGAPPSIEVGIELCAVLVVPVEMYEPMLLSASAPGVASAVSMSGKTPLRISARCRRAASARAAKPRGLRRGAGPRRSASRRERGRPRSMRRRRRLPTRSSPDRARPSPPSARSGESGRIPTARHGLPPPRRAGLHPASRCPRVGRTRRSAAAAGT